MVFIGSTHSQRAFPGVSPYAATKGAVETLTGVLAAELGVHQIRVSCLRPGGVFTEINQRAGLVDDAGALARLESLAPAHALGRLGTAAEIAEGIEYLVRAEWVTGRRAHGRRWPVSGDHERVGAPALEEWGCHEQPTVITITDYDEAERCTANATCARRCTTTAR